MIPMTMVGRLDQCVLLTYSTPEEAVRELLPKPLELITYKGRAFWNIVVCHVDKMRPKGLPRFFGSSYLHVAYRLQARARLKDGSTIEGLYFVRSDVDDSLMALGGNIQTDFKFHASTMFVRWEGELHFEINGAGGFGAILRARPMGSMALTSGSVYADLAEREGHLKYHPFGLSVSGKKLKVAEVKRVEAEWQEEGLEVLEADWAYLRSLGQNQLVLERATRVAAIDYTWKLGRGEALA